MVNEERLKTRRIRIRWAAVLGDMKLYVALCQARLIVWRAIRRERKERLVSKRIRLIQN